MIEPKRGDIGEGPNAADPQYACNAGFPHKYLEWIAGGIVHGHIVQLQYLCLLCGVVVEFNIPVVDDV